jgi:lantibiotic modifying enzyme
MTPISATLSSEDREAIAHAIATIKNRLPFLIDLVGKEHASYAKIGDKSRAFVVKALEVASHNSEFLPRSFDVEEMRKDMALYDDLSGLMMTLMQLQDLVNDTCLVVGSEAYTAALTVYTYAKKSGQNSNGVAPLVDEMGQLFRRKRKPKAEEVKAEAIA